MGLQRILFRFSKKGDARFLSHHDLMRLFERALRRAELPVGMSQGFNPHPRLSILSALPLGLEADDEAIEIAFEPPVAPAEALGRLREQLPQGIGLRSAEETPDGARGRVESVVYEVDLPPGCEVGPAAVEGFLAQDAILVERPGRGERPPLDIRGALAAMALEGRRLRFEVRLLPGGTPKATEVLAAVLGRPWPADAPARIRRTRVNLAVASVPHTS